MVQVTEIHTSYENYSNLSKILFFPQNNVSKSLKYIFDVPMSFSPYLSSLLNIFVYKCHILCKFDLCFFTYFCSISVYVTVNLNQSSSQVILEKNPVETAFLDTILKLVYFLVVNNKYLRHIVDNILFGISVPDHPSRNVETMFLGQF